MKLSMSAVALAAGLLLAAGPSRAVTINFDDLAAGTVLSSQYASLGALFSPNAFTGAGQSSSGQPWATNTDMTIVSSTGPDTDNLGTPSLVGGMILDSYSGWLNENGDPSFAIVFTTPVAFVSADFAAVATGSDVAIYAYDGATMVDRSNGGSSYGQFLLSVSSPVISSVVITPGSYDDYVAVDNISFAQAVPEPSNLALMALGLGAVAMRRRKGRTTGR